MENDSYVQFKRLIKYDKNMEYFRERITPSDYSLLEKKLVKINTQDLNKLNVSIVHLAAKHNFLELLDHIIGDCQAPPTLLDLQTLGERTPLMLALLQGHLECARYLIE